MTYSVNSIGMKYERMLFGMKISDANCLAKAIQATETMSSLVLQVRGATVILVGGRGACIYMYSWARYVFLAPLYLRLRGYGSRVNRKKRLTYFLLYE